jgi:large subunit ribosomal protein L9
MEVILKEDIANLGKMGEVVRVREGYVRNYLLPKGLVVAANPKNLKAVEHNKRVVAAQKERALKQTQSLADRVAATSLTIRVRAGEEGKLFGSVTNIQIEKALKTVGLNIDRRKIGLEQPIKALGEYEVPVRLAADVVPALKISVVAAGEAPTESA